jgi:hypothetical protein
MSEELTDEQKGLTALMEISWVIANLKEISFEITQATVETVMQKLADSGKSMYTLGDIKEAFENSQIELGRKCALIMFGKSKSMQ